jgi:hypothetical protein
VRGELLREGTRRPGHSADARAGRESIARAVALNPNLSCRFGPAGELSRR